MAFGQQSGPPATKKQVDYLESLLLKAGHTSFRDARGPLGLTQRQAGGRFTRQEASELIDQLLAADPDAPEVFGATGSSAQTFEERRADEQLELQRAQALQGMPADLLADELRRRGWSVAEPDLR